MTESTVNLESYIINKKEFFKDGSKMKEEGIR